MPYDAAQSPGERRTGTDLVNRVKALWGKNGFTALHDYGHGKFNRASLIVIVSVDHTRGEGVIFIKF